MQKKWPWLSLVIAGAAAAVAPGAYAAGLGGGSSDAVLGQALDFTVALRLDAGASLSAECLIAEVTFGERRLPASAVRAQVEPLGAEGARIRILTTALIDEPVVEIQLDARCGAQVARRYVVLADPPLTPSATASAAVAAPAFAGALPEANVVTASASTAAPDGGGARTMRTAQGTAVPATLTRDVALREVHRSPSRVQRRAELRPQARRIAPSALRAQSTRHVRRAAESAPRLRLDFVEPSVGGTGAVEQALQAVALAAAAARQSASAASATAGRIAALERTVDQLRGEAKASRELATQLADRLARAEGPGALLWVLASVSALLAGLAVWLGLRLAAARRERHKAWLEATQATRRSGMQESDAPRQPTAPIPFVSSEIHVPTSGFGRLRTAPAWPPPVPIDDEPPAPSVLTAPTVELRPRPPAEPLPALRPRPAPVVMPPPPPPVQAPEVEPASQITAPLAAAPSGEGAGTRDVSIDELLDLEQQAEFFVVLGQDEAAIELLVEHLRHTGGGSPLPYLKLLEIFRRRGDRSDYERMRARFNHRFNAYAPEWEADLQSGRTLADYPGVIPRLQQVWARPLDSMAELEALLFRKSRGDLFDLPAYREVLLLYSLARDLLDREAADTGNVDLLLPMADGSDFSSTSPAPFLDLRSDSAFGRPDFEDRPTAPVDFDLSQDSDRPSSIFDPLVDIPSQPRRR